MPDPQKRVKNPIDNIEEKGVFFDASPLEGRTATQSLPDVQPYRGGIVGPPGVIQAVLADRKWTEVVSVRWRPKATSASSALAAPVEGGMTQCG